MKTKYSDTMHYSEETQYLRLLENILDDGAVKGDRTGTGTYSLFGCDLRFDISCHSLPVVTTRKIKPLDPIIEMLWFIKGDTNIRFLKEHNINIWDSWVREETKEFDTQGKLIAGSIGPGAYGAQWRRWEDTRIVSANEGAHYKKFGYEYVTNLTNPQGVIDRVVLTRTIDQLADAINMIKNNPDSRRIIVTAWNPGRFEDQALPPCFLADSLVSTPNGYKPISEIKEGDEVYTASMKVQKVNKVWKTPYKKGSPLIGLKCVGSPHLLISTPNHPHLVDGENWVEAQQIEIGDFLTIPYKNKNTTLKPYSFKYEYFIAKSKEYREYEETLSEKDYFSLGYFVGNGWFMENSNNRVCVAIPHKKVNYILDKFRETVKVSVKNNSVTESVATYETRSLKWSHVFKQCGHLAPNKQIPEWVFTSPINCINAFFEGFLEADGFIISEDKFQITTTSHKLALGLQRLASLLGFKSSTVFQPRPETTIIEGRVVNQNPTYNVRISKKVVSTETRSTLKTTKLLTKVVNYIPLETLDDTFVYNLDVGDEHTYIVDNFATHNCHSLFQFYTRDLSFDEKDEMISYMFEKNPQLNDYFSEGFDIVEEDELDEAIYLFGLPTKSLSLKLLCRSQDTPVGSAYNIIQYAALAHMVAQVTNTWATEFIWTSGDTHIYSNQVDGVRTQLERKPIQCDTKLVLNPEIKNIDDFKPSDISVTDYEHHPFIKYPIAI